MSGKLRAQRAKSMKFKDGYMISSGQPVNEYIDATVRHVLLRHVCLLCCLLNLVFPGLLLMELHMIQHWLGFVGRSWYQGEDYA